MLDQRTKQVHPQPKPSHAGTKHLVARSAKRTRALEYAAGSANTVNDKKNSLEA